MYVADDDPNVNLNSKPQSTPVKENPTYLVYNRISTVIGEGACQNISDRPTNENYRAQEQSRSVAEENITERDESRHDRRSVSRNEKSDNTKESAIWYEYGCV